jgi:glycosyltransferase involved in cell wall biosynthesis
LEETGWYFGELSLISRQLKILFLLTQDLESPSGLGRYWPLAHALATKGHHVRIAALHSNWEDLSNRKFLADNVEIEYVAPMHIKKSKNQKYYYSPFKLLAVAFRATWELYRSAISAPVDIIHIGKPHPMNSLAGLFASMIKGARLCVDCDDYEAESNRIEKRWQKTGVTFFEKRIPRIARLVTTNTNFMKSKLIHWGCSPDRILYLSNGVDVQRYPTPNPDEINKLRSELGLGNKQTVLYLGSLSLPSHPVDLLLEAFVFVFQKFSNTALLLVGGGEDYLKLKDMAKELGIDQATIFTGRIQPQKVPLYYALADVSVDPVYDNNAAKGRSPLKLFESWVCGVPFVTAPVGDRQFILGEPPAGIISQRAGDPKSLAESIIEILASKNLAQELLKLGKVRVDDYTWDRLATQLEQEYQKIL